MVRRRQQPRPGPEAGADPRLAHLLLVGGTTAEWDAFDAAAWTARVDRLAEVAAAVGASWVTVRPIGDGSGAARPSAEVRVDTRADVTVIVDPEPDARARFARALEALAAQGAAPAEVTEARLAPLLCQAPDEPDLAVILGPSDRLPTSVSWELAYAEMVFLEIDWVDLGPEHLRLAVEQFRHRDRRFGGVDQ